MSSNLDQKNFGDKSHEEYKCTQIMCENSFTIKFPKNPVIHGKSQHIDVRYHFLRDVTREGIITLDHCKSEAQLVDLMTKPLRLEIWSN